MSNEITKSEREEFQQLAKKRQRNGLFLSLAAIIGIVAIFCRTIVLLVEMLAK